MDKEKLYRIVTILAFIALLLVISLKPGWGVEWRVWSGERFESVAQADSFDAEMVSVFGKWHELKDSTTNWRFKINNQWIEQEGTRDTLTLPMKYIWITTDSSIEIYRNDTNPFNMRWFYEVFGQTIVDEDYELHAVNIISGSLIIEDVIFIGQNIRLRNLRVPNKVVDHRKMVLAKKAKKVEKVIALMGAELWARSLDGKQHNVFGNRIRNEWLELIWPENEKQWRPMGWKLLKLESKGRIKISRVEP